MFPIKEVCSQVGEQSWKVYWNRAFFVLENLCTGKFAKNVLKVLEYTRVWKIVYCNILE